MLQKTVSNLWFFVQSLKLSYKNIWRNRRRTMITISSIVIGTLALSLLLSYVETMYQGLKADAINKQFGHLQVGAKGYFDSDETSYDHLLDLRTLEKVKKHLQSMEQIDYVNTRLHIAGLIGNERNSVFFSGICGEPATETLMSPDIIEGLPLSESDPYGVLIGKAMAEKLKTSLNQRLILLINTSYGSQEAIEVTVRGIYDTVIDDQEKIIIYMPVKAAWDLLLEKKVHRLLIFLKNEKDLPAVTEELNRFLNENRLNLEVRDWETLATFIRQVIGMFSGMSMVVGTIMFLIIIFNINNTMHMAIYERFHEIGALRALGISRKEIMVNFISEGFLIGMTGAVIGTLLTVALIPLINGLDLTLPPGPGQSAPTPVHFTVTLSIIKTALSVNFITATLASVSPARHGARIKIIEALRYV